MTLDDDAIVAATVGKTVKDPEMREHFGASLRSLCAAARRGEPANLIGVLCSYRNPNPEPDDVIESTLKALSANAGPPPPAAPPEHNLSAEPYTLRDLAWAANYALKCPGAEISDFVPHGEAAADAYAVAFGRPMPAALVPHVRTFAFMAASDIRDGRSVEPS